MHVLPFKKLFCHSTLFLYTDNLFSYQTMFILTLAYYVDEMVCLIENHDL